MRDTTVCVFVPCFNRAEYTKMTLTSLTQNTKHQDAHLFLADDGSTDETGEVLIEYANRKDTPFRKIHLLDSDGNKGLRWQTSRFLKTAKPQGERPCYVVKLDNDVLVKPGWLGKLAYVMDNSDCDVLNIQRVPNNRRGGLYGGDVKGLLYRPSRQLLSGLWMMRFEVILEMGDLSVPEKAGKWGDTSRWMMRRFRAANRKIIIGWNKEVLIEHVGHVSGRHALHIKTEEYAKYTRRLGRRPRWRTKMKDLKDVFDVLNKTGVKYVVLRNFQGLPETAQLGAHGDLDLLVEDRDAVASALGAEKCQTNPLRVQYKVPVGDSYQLTDLRYVGDLYYPTEFAKAILAERVLHPGGFYIPRRDHYFWSLLYHAIIHKVGSKISQNYTREFRSCLQECCPFIDSIPRPSDKSVAHNVR